MPCPRLLRDMLRGHSIPRSFHRRLRANTREPARRPPTPDRSLVSFRLTGHKAAIRSLFPCFRSHTQGASALALAVALVSLSAPPGKAQEGPGQELPPAESGGAIALRTVEVTAPEEGEAPGSSQGGAGLGGRFTGYTVDLNTPAMATKDNILILQTPANVQVVPRQVMDDQQDISVRDAIVGYVSSVQPPSTTPDSSNFYDGFNIRGIDNVNIIRNDLRVWEITGIETANLQSIEILKGPAAFLFGRLEPGGIVNLVVKQPLDVPYYSVQEQTDSFGLTRTTVDATGPMTDDKTWLYRVDLDYTHSASFTDFVTTQNAFIGPTITYHPIEQFRFNLEAEYQNTIFVDTANGFPAVGTGPAPLPISRYLEDTSILTSAAYWERFPSAASCRSCEKSIACNISAFGRAAWSRSRRAGPSFSRFREFFSGGRAAGAAASCPFARRQNTARSGGIFTP